MHRTHREHLTVSVASIPLIALGWLGAAGMGDFGYAMAWMTLAFIAEWRILARVRGFESRLERSEADCEPRIMRELTILTAVLTGIFTVPAAMLAARGGMPSLAAIIVAAGVLLNISAQHVLHRRMILFSLPLPALVLLQAALTIGGPGHEHVSLGFALVLILHTFTINRASVQSYEGLIHARLRAEEAGRAKSQFLANMSHELRTPLNAIIGYAEIIEEDLEIDENTTANAEDARRIRRAARHLLTLINEVLDLSKIEAGRLELTCAPVDVAAMLADVEETVRPIAASNGNRIAIDIVGVIDPVLTDPDRFKQCLINLATNACKFTSGGRITLRASIDRRNGENVLNVAVEDTGIGISAEDQARLFQPFVQVDASETRRQDGTGLGLAIVKHIVNRHRGRLLIESQLGEGSVFTVHLPLATAAGGNEAAMPGLLTSS